MKTITRARTNITILASITGNSFIRRPNINQRNTPMENSLKVKSGISLAFFDFSILKT